MQSPNRRYLPEADELRGAAALLIVFYHSVHSGWAATGHTGWIRSEFPPSALLYEGHVFLTLFVVLSGFVLALDSFGKQISYRQFLVNRALRLLPLMVFVTVFGAYGSLPRLTVEGMSAAFLLLGNTPLRFPDATELSGNIWTVSLAFQLYLIAPLVIACVDRIGVKFVAGAVGLTMLAHGAVAFANADQPSALISMMHSSVVGRLSQFLMGIGLAYVFQGRLIRSERSHSYLLLAIGLTCLCFYVLRLNHHGGFYEWSVWRTFESEMVGVLVCTVIFGYLFAAPLKNTIFSSWLVKLGLMSYSVFVVHWPIQKIFWSFYRDHFPGVLGEVYEILLITAVVLLPAMLAVSFLSYAVLERPFLALRRSYLIPLAPRDAGEAGTPPGSGEPEPQAAPSLPIVLIMAGAAVCVAAFLVLAVRPWLGSERVPADACLRWSRTAVPLEPPFSEQGRYGFVAAAKPIAPEQSDTAESPRRSTAVLCEDDKVIGTPHSAHSEIAGRGHGRYSHWSGYVVFSSSDGSDPRTNGRKYALVFRDPGAPASAPVRAEETARAPKPPAASETQAQVPADACERWWQTAVPLEPPFSPQGAYGFVAGARAIAPDESDTAESPQRSTAVLCEDGKVIGPPHSAHADIAERGQGRYSHWSGYVVFSSSDGTDPRTNGRQYALVFPDHPR